MWQKVFALAARAEVQARDVFDLGVLLDSRHDKRHGPVEAGFLRAHLTDEILREAGRRALEISPQEFRDQVAEFLPTEKRARHSAAWLETQVAVATFIEDVRRQPLDTGQVPALPKRGRVGGRNQ